MILLLFLAALFVAMVAWLYFRQTVTWHLYSFPGIEISVPNITKVDPEVIYTDYKKSTYPKFPYTAYAFEGEQRTGFDRGPYFAQKVILMIFPSQSFLTEPIRYEKSEVSTTSWEYFITRSILQDGFYPDSQLQLVKETDEYRIFSYQRRTDNTALFLLSKIKPYLIAIQYYPDTLSTSEEIKRIEKIQGSLSIDISLVK